MLPPEPGELRGLAIRTRRERRWTATRCGSFARYFWRKVLSRKLRRMSKKGSWTAALVLLIGAVGCGGGGGGAGGAGGNGGGGGATSRELTFPAGIKGASPRFSPDGALLAYTRDNGTITAISVMSPDGTGSRDLAMDGSYLTAMTWSGDGAEVIYAGDNDVRAVPAQGGAGHQVVNAFAAVGPDLVSRRALAGLRHQRRHDAARRSQPIAAGRDRPRDERQLAALLARRRPHRFLERRRDPADGRRDQRGERRHHRRHQLRLRRGRLVQRRPASCSPGRTKGSRSSPSARRSRAGCSRTCSRSWTSTSRPTERASPTASTARAACSC